MGAPSLPTNSSWDMARTQWAAILNKLLGRPLSNPSYLSGVVLANGTTVVNHMLGQTPQGWFVTDANGAATIYRSSAFNPLTLTLTSNAAVTVSLVVF